MRPRIWVNSLQDSGSITARLAALPLLTVPPLLPGPVGSRRRWPSLRCGRGESGCPGQPRRGRTRLQAIPASESQEATCRGRSPRGEGRAPRGGHALCCSVRPRRNCHLPTQCKQTNTGVLPKAVHQTPAFQPPGGGPGMQVPRQSASRSLQCPRFAGFLRLRRRKCHQ